VGLNPHTDRRHVSGITEFSSAPIFDAPSRRDTKPSAPPRYRPFGGTFPLRRPAPVGTRFAIRFDEFADERWVILDRFAGKIVMQQNSSNT